MNPKAMDQPPAPPPPDLDRFESLEECAHQAWIWAYQVVQFNAEDEENLTREEHREAHRLTVQLLIRYLWFNVGISPTDDREEEFLDAVRFGWLRYACDNVVERTHILEDEGVIDAIDDTLKLATRGTLYEEGLYRPEDDSYDDEDPNAPPPPPFTLFEDDQEKPGDHGGANGR